MPKTRIVLTIYSSQPIFNSPGNFMAFDWQDYFKLAQILRQNPVVGLDEASKRTVVSRAYYAAFHIASNYALNSKHPPTLEFIGSDHRLIIAFFRQNTKIPSVANLLSDLRDWRNLCDYRSPVSNLDRMVENSIERTQQVINLLASH
jgi:uncharacterized protein (UPF0332 family)